MMKIQSAITGSGRRSEVSDRLAALRQLRRCTVFPDWEAATRKADAIIYHQRCLALIRAGRRQSLPLTIGTGNIR